MLHLPGASWHTSVRNTFNSSGKPFINQIIRDVADCSILKEAQRWAVTSIYSPAVKRIILHKPQNGLIIKCVLEIPCAFPTEC